jgi:hypothetical protein
MIMKKICIQSFVTGVIGLFFQAPVLAQTGQALLIIEEAKRPSKLVQVAGAKPGTALYVEAKVVRSFNRFFHEDTPATWSVNEKGYTAHFTSEDRTALAFISSNGQMEYTVFYGREKDLPADEKELIRSRYFDYKVSAVQEVNRGRERAWVVVLESGNIIRKVKIADGEITEMERMEKN